MNQKLVRGPLLTTYLLLATLVAIFSFAIYLFGRQAMLSQHPAWAVYSLTAVAFLRLPATLALWFWSRLAVISQVFLTIIAIPLCLAIGFRFSYISIIGIVILVLLFHKKWRDMPWGIGG